jgi:hypothetical protein
MNVVDDSLLTELHDRAWGKPWPRTTDNTISLSDISSSDNNKEELLGPLAQDVETATEQSYICFRDIGFVQSALRVPISNSDVLVILSEYDRLRDTIEARALETRAAFVVTGHPGIGVYSVFLRGGHLTVIRTLLVGKTTFLLYLLLSRLERQLPTAIQVSPEEYFIFDDNGAMSYASGPRGGGAGRLSQCWGLTDSNANLERPTTIFMSQTRCLIQTTSPQVRWWKEWAKQRQATRLITSLPKVLEIGAIM